MLLDPSYFFVFVDPLNLLKWIMLLEDSFEDIFLVLATVLLAFFLYPHPRPRGPRGNGRGAKIKARIGHMMKINKLVSAFVEI